MTVSNLPPQDLVVERSLLGSIFAADGACLDVVIPEVSAEDFYLASFASLYRACIQIHMAGEKVNAGRAREVAAKFGSAESLTDDLMVDLMGCEPHDAHALYYARKIADFARSRALIGTCTDAIRECYNRGHDIDEIAGALESKARAIVEKKLTGRIVSASELAYEFIASLDSEEPAGLATGFCDFDSLTQGLKPCSLNIVAARPSMGKTAFVQNIARNVAENGNSVMFFSLEQDKLELGRRFISSMTTISTELLYRSRDLTEDQRAVVIAAGSRFAGLPIFTDDTSEQSLLRIAARARTEQRKHDIKLVIVDYLQIVEPDDSRMPREQQIANLTRKLKQLAKTLKLPVIALAQLNRSIESREEKTPRLSDLRESGAIEQDADVVMFLHRPEMYEKADRPGEADLIVAKNRNGRTGKIALCWHAESVTFRNAAHNSQFPEFT